MNKEVIRQRALSKRRSLSSQQIHSRSERIGERLFALSVFRKAKLVLFYISLPEEVQTHGMIKGCFREAKKVAVTTVDCATGEIVPFEIKKPDFDLICGAFDIPEPAEKDRYPVYLPEIDLVVVPGVAYSEKGERIGFGGGFYDRLLRQLRPDSTSVAVCFECQIMDNVPCEEHDVSVDCIVTERRVINCKGG